ncbi:MAG: DNA-methyltransferase [Campylobacter sp.]
MKINEIYNTECLNFMQNMPENSVDLILTDPPYEIYTKGGGASKRPLFTNNKVDKFSNGFDINAVFSQCERICKKLNLFCFCSNKQISKIMSWGEERGYNATLLAWHKPNALPFTNNTFKSDLEFCVYMREIGVKIKGRSKLFTHNCGKSKFNHPTEKPLKIIKELILVASKNGDLVFDPFIGSGTTAVACKELNRNFLGCEIEAKYCEIAEKRLKDTVKGLI